MLWGCWGAAASPNSKEILQLRSSAWVLASNSGAAAKAALHCAADKRRSVGAACACVGNLESKQLLEMARNKRWVLWSRLWRKLMGISATYLWTSKARFCRCHCSICWASMAMNSCACKCVGCWVNGYQTQQLAKDGSGNSKGFAASRCWLRKVLSS